MFIIHNILFLAKVWISIMKHTSLVTIFTFIRYWLFRAWGRIGTPIGGNKLENCSSLSDAVEKFETLYMERTQNPWSARDNFVKVVVIGIWIVIFQPLSIQKKSLRVIDKNIFLT